MISVKGQLQCADLMQRKQNFGLVLIYYSLLSNYIKNEKVISFSMGLLAFTAKKCTLKHLRTFLP